MNILISPNAFKNSLSAGSVARAIQKGLMQSKLDCNCECFPVGDGGDGTGLLLTKKCNGTTAHVMAHDPLGRIVNASFGLIDSGKTAVIEMASASGLRLLQTSEFNPLIASSYGTGEVIRAALDHGVTKIIIGMGGSATVDGGTGILKALGIRFLDEAGKELVNLPADIRYLDSIDFSALDVRVVNCEFIVLCDVGNKLLGESGAAATFGPQKGASETDVKDLEAALGKLAQVALKQMGKDLSDIKCGGTAGGAAWGLHTFLDAQLTNGIEYFLRSTDFDSSLKKADLVITGEGSIDEQTLQGKGPFGVARLAKQKGCPVIGLAGMVPLEPSANLQQYFDVLISIGNQPAGLPAALAATKANLVRVSRDLGSLLSLRM